MKVHAVYAGDHGWPRCQGYPCGNLTDINILLYLYMGKVGLME